MGYFPAPLAEGDSNMLNIDEGAVASQDCETVLPAYQPVR